MPKFDSSQNLAYSHPMRPLVSRYIESCVTEDLQNKMVFIGGPRQVGKTFLAKRLIRQFGGDYCNWDIDDDRTRILEKNFSNKGLIVFDELHKFKRWRNWLKGLYDGTREGATQILVTGSARLDLYRFGGDSLQGRYHYLRLYPFTVAELKLESQSDLRDLLTFSGFPEPFLKGESRSARRWSQEYRRRLIRDEVPTLERIEDLGSLELLTQRIPALVGAPLSINNLREDLDRAFKTVKNWLFILEKLYHLFPVPPLGGSTLRAVKKERKYYLYDWSLVGDEGCRFENLVACHLLKWIHYQEDVEGYLWELRYFRDRDGREVDFVLVQNEKPQYLIECKLSDIAVSLNLLYLKRRFPNARAIQLVLKPSREFKHQSGVEVISALNFLRELV